MDVKQLREIADELFSKKSPLTSLHQEIADHFYPERADFTVKRSLGTDFAAQLSTSYPVRCRRELGNQFATMLRPTARPWFHVRRKHEDFESEGVEVKSFLEYFEKVQRKVMYDSGAQFLRATKEGDHDFAAFGQCVISVELNKNANGLLYRSWHLRDVAWQENEQGKIGFVVRRDKMRAWDAKRTFGDRVHEKVTKIAEKTPFEQIECYHFVVEAEMYNENARGLPRWSIWYDVQHDHVMQAVPIWGRHYVIPRWQTVSGSQYSYSPATVCALPDARLLQAMTFTLLEAGEKASQPPIIATRNVVRSDVSLYAGGITWVDEEYDERLGAALRPLEQDFRGLSHGLQMNADTRAMLQSAFFLDVLTMPQRGPEMTAYEVGQRVQEYIRNALPIFEPTEMEYNAPLCEETFNMIRRLGGFGAESNWPRQLRGAEITFGFESPLHDAIEQQKGQKFQEATALIGQAIALDPTTAFLPRSEVALRDALLGIGVPAQWLNNEAAVAEAKRAQQQAMAQQQQLAALEQASNAAKNLGQAGVIPAQPAAA